MSKLFNYFKNDFPYITMDRKLEFSFQYNNDETELIEVHEKIPIEHNSSTRFFCFYIPESNLSALFIREILTNFEKRKDLAKGVDMICGFSKDIAIGKHNSVYSNRIYFYSETPISKKDLEILAEIATKNDLYCTIRSKDYLERKMEIEKPLAFISHDSRDKDLIAKRLAIGLSSRLCPVWYDEFSLNIGDSLRQSIENGIKEVKKCILIITKNFLANPGWSKKEFDSIFTREMIFNERIVLPIWYGVTKEEVYEYSPSLADTVALKWPDNKELDPDDYKKDVELLISKIHTAIKK